MKATNILVWAAAWDTFVTNDGRLARVDPARIYGIKRQLVLFDLLYWEVLHGKGPIIISRSGTMHMSYVIVMHYGMHRIRCVLIGNGEECLAAFANLPHFRCNAC